MLVVEPESELCNELVDALRVRSLGVLSTHGSREALAVMDRYEISALVIDAHLPLMSGFDLAKAIRNHPNGKKARIIIITDVAWNEPQRQVAIKNMDLLDLQVKPIDSRKLADRLVSAVGSPVSLATKSLWRDTQVATWRVPQKSPEERPTGVTKRMLPSELSSGIPRPDQRTPGVLGLSTDPERYILADISQAVPEDTDVSESDPTSVLVKGSLPEIAMSDVEDTDIHEPSPGDPLAETNVTPGDPPGDLGDLSDEDLLTADEDLLTDTSVDSSTYDRAYDPGDELSVEGGAGEEVDWDLEEYMDDGPPTAPGEAPPMTASTFSSPSSEYFADLSSHSEKQQVEEDIASAQAGPVEHRGNLSTTSFPGLLCQLYHQRVTGGLFLLSGRVKKIVYFKEGHPSYIKSNRLSECLGKILVREGMITEEQCKESLRLMAEEARQQGAVLMEMGLLTPHQLVAALEVQLRAKLMDIFTWTRAEYMFKRNSKVPAEIIHLDVSNATLIADGVRETWSAVRLEAYLEPYMDMFLVPNPNPEMRFQELSVEPDEQALMARIDGSRTLSLLTTETQLSSKQVMAVAYVLLITGVVEARDRPDPQDVSRPAASPPGLKGQSTWPGVREFAAGEESVRETLAARLIELRQQDALTVLGVKATSLDVDVQQAFAMLAGEYHMDKYRHLPRETKRLAEEIFKLILRAYEKVSTMELRKAYEPMDREPVTPGVVFSGSNSLEAERFKRKALSLMKAESWPEARQVLADAVKLCDDAGDLRALLAWATYKSNPETAAMVRSAIQQLRKAIELDPNLALIYLTLGRIYASMGKNILAEKQFLKALQCNPDSEEALEELRIQQERRPPRRYRS